VATEQVWLSSDGHIHNKFTNV